MLIGIQNLCGGLLSSCSFPFARIAFVLLLLGLLRVCLGDQSKAKGFAGRFIKLVHPSSETGADVASSFFISSSTTDKLEAALQVSTFPDCYCPLSHVEAFQDLQISPDLERTAKNIGELWACSCKDPKGKPVIFLVPPGRSSLGVWFGLAPQDLQ